MKSEDSSIHTHLITLAKTNFKGLEEYLVKSGSAKFYKGSFDDSSLYIIKVFEDRYLFRQELMAFYFLQTTGRVCKIICDSTRLEEYWEPNFSGPYFIAKPFFKKLFSDENIPLRLLVRCAEQVDISSKFLEERLRDFDGRYENDAIDQGRVIRFDLDAAEEFSFCYPKFSPQLHSNRQKIFLKQIQENLELIFSEADELSSLVIRFSRLFLDKMDSSWSLLENIIRHREKGVINVPTNNLDWINLFETNLSSEQKYIFKFTPSEARCLGSLFYHVLSRQDHGFSLQDMYYSLMLMGISFLKFRHQNYLKRMEEADRNQYLIEDLQEIYKFVSDIQVSQTQSMKEVSKKPAPIITYKYGGGMWAAVRKGTDWECQDLVIGPQNDDTPLFLIADGASLAKGSEAIKIVERIFQSWNDIFIPGTLNETKKALEDLALGIHNELLLLGRTLKGSCETTLGVFIIANIPDGISKVLLIRFGNVGFLITRESTGKKPEYLSRSLYREVSLPLGSNGLDIKSKISVIEIPLDKEGIYRIRAFSDGLMGGGEKAEQLLERHSDIKDLVKEAETWDRHFPLMGDDDWSVAGFDIFVGNGSYEDKSLSISNKEESSTVSPWKILDQIDVNCNGTIKIRTKS